MTYYDKIYNQIKAGDVLEQELKLIQILSQGKKILDIGCGTGRHLIPILKKGFLGSGIEPSEDMIQTLLSNLNNNNIKYEIKNNEIVINSESIIYKVTTQEFEKVNTYDLIILMWNAINEIAKTEEELEELVRKLKTLLNIKGKILINIDDVTKIDLKNIDHELISHDDEFTYRQKWKIEEFDKQTNITQSREIIQKFDSNENLTDTEENIVIQKWWGLSELEGISNKLNLNIIVKSINSNEELYVVLG